jgi:excisionase family DNA binding protein
VDKRLWVAGAAEYLGVCKGTVYALVAAKALPHFRVGRPGRRGRIVILESDCAAYLQAHRVGADESPAAAPRPPRTRSAFRHLNVG